MYNIINIEARILPKKAKDEEGNKLANIEQHATNYLISGEE